MVLLIGLISNHAIGDPQNCSGAHLNTLELGGIGEIDYDEPISPMELTRRALEESAQDMLYLSDVKPLPGEESAYLSAAMGYLNGEESSSYSCLLGNWKEGDKLLPFREVGESTERAGYVLFREGKAIVFLYQRVINV
ncbi:hypothetical protein [Haliea sp.]|uniref:hypothetical protein n=1 Tax=Haliea sp. TaxID=1932666 RepID=UPI0025C54026|nr:hypothetical protein [Haliea sp.]